MPLPCPALRPPQAYEGLRTADRLKEEYVFLPAKVRAMYGRLWGGSLNHVHLIA